MEQTPYFNLEELKKIAREGNLTPELAKQFLAAKRAKKIKGVAPISAPTKPDVPSITITTPDTAPATGAVSDKEKHELNKGSLLTYVREFSAGAEGVILDQGVFASQFNISTEAAQRIVNTLVEKGILDAGHKVILNGLVAGDISEAEITEAIKEPMSSVATPDVAPKAPEKKYGFTNRELLEFLKTKAGTNFSDNTLLENFNLSKGHAAEVIRDLKQARIIGDDNKVMDSATLERAEKDFEGHPTETLDDEYTFAHNEVGSTDHVNSTPNTKTSPENKKTFEEFLKIPDWETSLNRLNSFSQSIESDLNTFVKKIIDEQIKNQKEKSKIVPFMKGIISRHRGDMVNFYLYRETLSKNEFIESKEISIEQKEEIAKFLENENTIKQKINLFIDSYVEALRIVESMDDATIKKASEDPLNGVSAGLKTPEQDPNIGLSAANNSVEGMSLWDRFAKNPRHWIMASAGALAFVALTGSIGYLNRDSSAPEKAKAAPELNNKSPAVGSPATAAPDSTASKPIGTPATAATPGNKQENKVTLSPNYESSVWWKTLAPEVQTDIKELLEAGDAKSYALKFFNEIKLLNINGTVNISEKTKSDLYDQIDKYKGFLNLAYSKSDIVISQCVITVEEATTKEKKDCYVRENVATLANKYRGILGKALGENMYAPFPDEQTLSESYEMMKNKIAAKTNEELNKK